MLELTVDCHSLPSFVGPVEAAVYRLWSYRLPECRNTKVCQMVRSAFVPETYPTHHWLPKRTRISGTSRNCRVLLAGLGLKRHEKRESCMLATRGCPLLSHQTITLSNQHHHPLSCPPCSEHSFDIDGRPINRQIWRWPTTHFLCHLTTRLNIREMKTRLWRIRRRPRGVMPSKRPSIINSQHRLSRPGHRNIYPRIRVSHRLAAVRRIPGIHFGKLLVRQFVHGVSCNSGYRGRIWSSESSCSHHWVAPNPGGTSSSLHHPCSRMESLFIPSALW